MAYENAATEQVETLMGDKTKTDVEVSPRSPSWITRRRPTQRRTTRSTRRRTAKPTAGKSGAMSDSRCRLTSRAGRACAQSLGSPRAAQRKAASDASTRSSKDQNRLSNGFPGDPYSAADPPLSGSFDIGDSDLEKLKRGTVCILRVARSTCHQAKNPRIAKVWLSPDLAHLAWRYDDGAPSGSVDISDIVHVYDFADVHVRLHMKDGKRLELQFALHKSVVMLCEGLRFLLGGDADFPSSADPPQKKTCYYEVLGVERRCDDAALKSSYRRLALKMHPDRAAQNDLTVHEATKRFQELQEAYAVLADPYRRSLYDMYGENWQVYSECVIPGMVAQLHECVVNAFSPISAAMGWLASCIAGGGAAWEASGEALAVRRSRR